MDSRSSHTFWSHKEYSSFIFTHSIRKQMSRLYLAMSDRLNQNDRHSHSHVSAIKSFVKRNLWKWIGELTVFTLDFFLFHYYFLHLIDKITKIVPIWFVVEFRVLVTLLPFTVWFVLISKLLFCLTSFLSSYSL